MGVDPVTKVTENGKAYNRRKMKQQALKNHRRYEDEFDHISGGFILYKMKINYLRAMAFFATAAMFSAVKP